MPRNGSGVYSADWVSASPNTTIESSKQNAMVADLVTDANAARPITAGGTDSTTAAGARTALAVPGLATENVFTKTQIWAKGADVTSAAALTVGDDGNYFDVIDTNAITSIVTVGVGAVIKLHFDGILTLTHHATDLILPGGANITTAAGDEAEFIEYATGDWRCTNYQRASGLGPSAATQAEQETATSTTVYVTPGRQHFHPSAAKAWLKCDTAGAIAASYNVTSIADTGTGLVDVSFATAFSSANYAIIATNNDGTNAFQVRITNVSGQAAGGCTLKTVNAAALIDPVAWFMAAFGDL